MNMRTRPYEELIVWKETHELCLDVYKLMPQYPTEERFALCSQIRRAAYSAPMNLVEGNCKRSRKEKLHYVETAEASLEERDYQLLLSRDLKYITADQFQKLRERIGKVSYLLTKFRSGIRKTAYSVTPLSLLTLLFPLTLR